jgi:hypothetical protein
MLFIVHALDRKDALAKRKQFYDGHRGALRSSISSGCAAR